MQYDNIWPLSGRYLSSGFHTLGEEEQRPPSLAAHACPRVTLVTSDPHCHASSDLVGPLAPYSPGCPQGTGLATV